MTALFFVDTNLLTYSLDASEPSKQIRAQEWLDFLWREQVGRTSVQVLVEFYATLTRKLRPGLAPDVARSHVNDLWAWRPLVVDRAVISLAWSIESRFQLSWWDATIVAAAQLADCRYMVTEDLQHGQRFASVEVVNPFLKVPGDFPG
jgi:predicted nucleic acid-binding protein